MIYQSSYRMICTLITQVLKIAFKPVNSSVIAKQLIHEKGRFKYQFPNN